MPEQGYKKYAEERVETEEAKKKYHGEYPADKAELGKYHRGEDYKGADGKTRSPKKKMKKGPIVQPDERPGIDEKVKARRKERYYESQRSKSAPGVVPQAEEERQMEIDARSKELTKKNQKYKPVLKQKEWMKKHGKTGTEADVDAYQRYLEDSGMFDE